MNRPELAALRLGDPPERWAALGFAVSGAAMDVGGVRVELGVEGEGIVGWELREGSEWRAGLAAEHPNGVTGIDHVVLVTPDFDATDARLQGEGMGFRRVREVPGGGGREGFRQGFRRLGPAILEVVEAREADAERFWGITFIASDLDALGRHLGERLGAARTAVQPGRRIATLRSEKAGIGCAVAFMTAE